MSQKFVEQLKEILGPNGWLEGEDTESYLTDMFGKQGETPLVARPDTTEQVSEVVRICAANNVAIIPQGGNTNVCRMAIPPENKSAVILSMARMNKIIDIDPECSTITAEAGCFVQSLQDYAREHNRLFSPDWGARGSAMIGGAVATNGGGQNVFRYGTTREQVLGMEVVLPDGQIWDGIRALRKDNSGYDLKQLFIGSEGTLGIITKLVFKLHPNQGQHCSLFGILTGMSELMNYLELAQKVGGDKLTAFELLPGLGVEKALNRYPALQRPLDQKSDWYVLVRFSDWENVEELVTTLFEQGFEAGILENAVMSQNLEQENNLWEIRDQMIPTQYFKSRLLKWDVSVPISKITHFLDSAENLVREHQQSAIIYVTGHVGDGNIHYTVIPESEGDPGFDELCNRIYQDVDELVWSLGGSIAAEHGVGQLLKSRVRNQKSDVEYSMMQQLRHIFDPQGIMNPGKLIDS